MFYDEVQSKYNEEEAGTGRILVDYADKADYCCHGNTRAEYISSRCGCGLEANTGIGYEGTKSKSKRKDSKEEEPETVFLGYC